MKTLRPKSAPGSGRQMSLLLPSPLLTSERSTTAPITTRRVGLRGTRWPTGQNSIGTVKSMRYFWWGTRWEGGIANQNLSGARVGIRELLPHVTEHQFSSLSTGTFPHTLVAVRKYLRNSR